jgi:predicted porin
MFFAAPQNNRVDQSYVPRPVMIRRHHHVSRLDPIRAAGGRSDIAPAQRAWSGYELHDAGANSREERNVESLRRNLAIAALTGALLAPTVVHGQTSNVTLYGRLNLDVEVVNGRQADGSNPHVSRVSSNSSRFGLRGTESLGGGLSAIFQLESNVQADTGNASNSGLASRDTFVGLQGAWGTFRMGKMLVPQDDLHIIFGDVPTFTASILSTETIWGMTANTRAQGGFATRNGNAIRYDSPVWKGLSLETQLSLRDSSGNTDDGNNGDHPSELRHAYALSIEGFYKNGPLQLGIGYEGNEKVRGPDLEDHDYTVTAAYDFGLVRPALVYDTLKYETPTGSLKRKFWGISATAPLGPGIAYAFYGKAGNGTGSAPDGTRVAAGVTKGSDTGASEWEISYTYSLSQRTVIYAGYIKIQNQSRAAYNFLNPYTVNTACLSAANCPSGPNGSPAGLIVGMIHFF